MSDKSDSPRPQLPPTTTRHDSFAVLNAATLKAATLGAGLLVLAMACIGVVYWTPDVAVRAGATLLGMTLGASGIITLLAGDP